MNVLDNLQSRCAKHTEEQALCGLSQGENPPDLQTIG
jgi:hypothetical protein